MKKTEMIEFQWIEGSDIDALCISDQFNKWMSSNESCYPDFKAMHMRVISCRNGSDQHVETLFILFEFEAPMDYSLRPEDI